MRARLSRVLLGRRLPRKNTRLIFVPIAASGLAATLLVVLSTVWAGAESDIAALERQKQLVTTRLGDQVEVVAEKMGLMAAGYASLLSGSPQMGVPTRLNEARRFGDTVAAIFGFEKLFLVDGLGNFPFKEDAATVRRYQWIRPLLAEMLKRVQNKQAIMRAQPSASSDQALAELMRLEGRPSIVGIIPISDRLDPETLPSRVSPNTSHYLIGFRFLDGAALDDLSREMGLNGARYARTQDAENSEVAFQVEASATGDPIGVIIWTPDLPGSQVIERLTPFLAGAVAVLAILFLVLVLRLNRSWSELRRSEQSAREQSLHDVLTKLPNREFFAQRLAACHAKTVTGDDRSVIALIDLDRFKAVNDSFGHAAGDELILKAAARMQELLAGRGMLARLGGDEFALLLVDHQHGGLDYRSLCDEILAETKRPFHLNNGKITAHIGCSIGIAELTDGSYSPDELQRRADVALYRAKAAGRGCYVVYDAQLETGQRERELLTEELRCELARIQAVKPIDGSAFGQVIACHSAFEIHYQTIHRAGRENEITGAEALVRWRHPRLGLLSPDKFIPLAEERGLIDALGEFILEQACHVAKHRLDGRTIAVNVSPKQLRHKGFAGIVLNVLQHTQLPAACLELELTETALVDDPEQVKENLSKLRQAGVKIALDDFGTGFSSLSHLIDFGIDRIKIDRSFVRLLDRQSNGAAIAAAITTLGRSLGIETTAEGVETTAQRDFLVAIGCSDLQGYLMSKPVPVGQLPPFTANVEDHHNRDKVANLAS